MFKVLVVSSNYYLDKFHKAFQGKNFQVDIVTKKELKLDKDFLFQYQGIVFQIGYPLVVDTLMKLKQTRDIFDGIFIVADTYYYYHHQVLANAVHSEMYYLVSNGLDSLVRHLRFFLVSKFIENKGKIEYNEILLDLNTRKCFRSGNEIKLRNKEFELLELLASNPGRVFSISEILELVWDVNAIFKTNTVQSHISCLRNKIDKGYPKRYIHTINNVGYKLEAECVE